MGANAFLCHHYGSRLAEVSGTVAWRDRFLILARLQTSVTCKLQGHCRCLLLFQ